MQAAMLIYWVQYSYLKKTAGPSNIPIHSRALLVAHFWLVSSSVGITSPVEPLYSRHHGNQLCPLSKCP